MYPVPECEVSVTINLPIGSAVPVIQTRRNSNGELYTLAAGVLEQHDNTSEPRYATLKTACSYDTAGKLFLKARAGTDLIQLYKRFLDLNKFTTVELAVGFSALGRWCSQNATYECDDNTRETVVQEIIGLLPRPEYTALEPRQYSSFELYTHEAGAFITSAYDAAKEHAKDLAISVALAATISLAIVGSRYVAPKP